MKLLNAAFLGALCLAASVQAGLELCNGKDHDFTYEGVEYGPSPLSTTGEVRIAITGTLKANIPNDAKLRYTVKHGDEERKWEVDFYNGIKRESNSGSLLKSSSSQTITASFYFPVVYQFVKADDINIMVSAHKNDAKGREVRIFCVSGGVPVQ